MSKFLTRGAYNQMSLQDAFVMSYYHIQSILSSQNPQPVEEKLDTIINFVA